MALCAIAQACHQSSWQTVFRHSGLSGTNIIRNTVVGDRPSFIIIDSVADSGVTVSGLPDTTRINNQAVLSQCKHAVSGKLTKETSTCFVILKHQWHVRMPYQAKLRLEVGEILLGTAG